MTIFVKLTPNSGHLHTYIYIYVNDLTKGINTMKSVWKCVEAIRELDNSENIQIGFSSIMHRSDKDFSKEISELNVKL